MSTMKMDYSRDTAVPHTNPFSEMDGFANIRGSDASKLSGLSHGRINSGNIPVFSFKEVQAKYHANVTNDDSSSDDSSDTETTVVEEKPKKGKCARPLCWVLIILLVVLVSGGSVFGYLAHTNKLGKLSCSSQKKAPAVPENDSSKLTSESSDSADLAKENESLKTLASGAGEKIREIRAEGNDENQKLKTLLFEMVRRQRMERVQEKQQKSQEKSLEQEVKDADDNTVEFKDANSSLDAAAEGDALEFKDANSSLAVDVADAADDATEVVDPKNQE